MMMRVVASLLVVFCAASPVLAEDAPTTRPIIPALIATTQPAPTRFIVQGITRQSKTGGMAFRVAVDGGRQRSALYDPADGTPLFVSNGDDTLIYDLLGDRIVHLNRTRGFVSVDWDAQLAKPLTFSVGMRFHPADATKD